MQSDKYDKSKRFDKLKESKKIARKRPTINDVAELANVSTATVSRCLSKPELVRPDVRTRVEASVVELGYVLDGAAKTLKTHQSKTIGVIVPTLEIGGYASAIQAFEKTVAAEKYTAILGVSDFDADKELQLAHNLAEKGVDGIMLIGMDSDDRLISFLEKIHIPHVNSWHFRRDSKYHWVGFDNRAAIQAITSYVFQHGHRDVVFFVGGAEHANARTELRRQGFMDAISDYNLEFSEDLIFEVPYNSKASQLEFHRLWSLGNRPTAVVCANDILAIGVLRACKQIGLRVPDDISVTGFDGLDIMADLWAPITTMAVPAKQIGEASGNCLLNLLMDKNPKTLTELHCTLIEGGSVKSLI